MRMFFLSFFPPSEWHPQTTPIISPCQKSGNQVGGVSCRCKRTPSMEYTVSTLPPHPPFQATAVRPRARRWQGSHTCVLSLPTPRFLSPPEAPSLLSACLSIGPILKPSSSRKPAQILRPPWPLTSERLHVCDPTFSWVPEALLCYLFASVSLICE